MITNVLFLIWVLIFSTLWYVYLHKKTRISKKFIYIDNLCVVLLTLLFCFLLNIFIQVQSKIFYFIISIPVLFGISFLITMYRFWRTPKRKVMAKDDEVVSPADGNIIYLKKVEAGDTPVSIKNGLSASLSEIAHTKLLNNDCWLLGINMTPFDVHKNCAPVSGQIVLNKHISGQFLSLKDPKAIIRNERNTLVIKSASNEFFGIVQTASKLVRRIDSYVEEGKLIQQGDWFGMIRFGSQVDIILPAHYNIKVEIGEQVYAKTSIIASK